MRRMCLVGFLLLLPSAAVAQTAGDSHVPRTPWGAPDLRGIWDNRTITPLERPRQFAGKETLTAEEATAHEAATAEQRVGDRYYWDRGTRTVSDRRTALIVDPTDGRVPPLTPEGQRRFEDGRSQGVNGAEERTPTERCITRTVPRLPGLYNNNYQIFQTPGYVVILMEMIHEARLVPLDGRPQLAEDIEQWNGDSRGRWEGDTLVIDTTNFYNKTSFSERHGATPNMRLVERLTRVDRDTLVYEFTVEDPATWTSPWTVEVQMASSEDRLYGYACHEGNHGMAGILAGYRTEEREAARGSR